MNKVNLMSLECKDKIYEDDNQAQKRKVFYPVMQEGKIAHNDQKQFNSRIKCNTILINQVQHFYIKLKGFICNDSILSLFDCIDIALVSLSAMLQLVSLQCFSQSLCNGGKLLL